jgi:hypothetical protein
MKWGREPRGSKQREKWVRELVKTDRADDLIRPLEPPHKGKYALIKHFFFVFVQTYTREKR